MTYPRHNFNKSVPYAPSLWGTYFSPQPLPSKQYLYFAALRLIARDPEVHHWYERKVARPGALKGKTVVELMRKLAGALWHVGRGATFEAKRLFAAEPLAA